MHICIGGIAMSNGSAAAIHLRIFDRPTFVVWGRRIVLVFAGNTYWVKLSTVEFYQYQRRGR